MCAYVPEGDPSSQLLLTAQLLRVNPDVYTFWNQRKEFILQSVAADANKVPIPLYVYQVFSDVRYYTRLC
jgi:hypothetical protein